MICRLIILTFFISMPFAAFAQDPLLSKLVQTPENVLTMFREAGMSPSEHPLTDNERASVAAAFKALPPLHQRILKDHLAGLSFLDNMPNTALTSIVSPGRYHITFRAAILKQTISEWLTEKEQTAYNNQTDTLVTLHAGHLNAIIYVLLHETTHVIDGSLDLFKDLNTGFAVKFAKTSVERPDYSHQRRFTIIYQSLQKRRGVPTLPVWLISCTAHCRKHHWYPCTAPAAGVKTWPNA